MYKPNMKGTEDKMVHQRTSSAKKWLIRIYSFGAALNVIALIVAVTSASGSAIGLTIIGLVINGVTLAAIVKQWRVVLVICQIILFIGIGLSVITTFIGALLLGALSSDFTEEQKSLMVTNIIFLSVTFVWNVFLFVLLRRYTNELASPSYA